MSEINLREQAVALDKSGDKVGAFELYVKAAEAGDFECYLLAAKTKQFDLKDPAGATEYYRLAAEKGIVGAYNPLAVAYKKGVGVDVNLEQAERYIALGAEAGDFLSIVNYATWLASGELGHKDEAKALELLKAAKDGPGYAKASDKAKAKADALLAKLDKPEEETSMLALAAKEDEPVKETKPDDGRAWVMGLYIVMIVLGVAGCVLAAFAANQLNQPGWFALYALFGIMIVGNVLPLAWKKLRYNGLHFYIDLGFAFLYIIAIVVCAVIWLKQKGL